LLTTIDFSFARRTKSHGVI